MARIVAICVLSLASFGPLTLWAQSDEDPVEIIDRFVEALGGEMTLRGIETLSAEAKYEKGTTAQAKFYVKGDRFLNSINYGGSDQRRLFDGKQWFKQDGAQATPLETRDEIYTREAVFDLPIQALRLQEQADEFEVVPKEEYADSDYAHCTCLRFANGSAANIWRYFDPDSDLMVCVERYARESGDDRKLRIRFYDLEYEEHEGLLFLKQSKRMNTNDWVCHVSYSNFQIDVPLDDSLFELETDDD